MSETPEGAGHELTEADMYFDKWNRLGTRVHRLEEELTAERQRVDELTGALREIEDMIHEAATKHDHSAFPVIGRITTRALNASQRTGDYEGEES